MLRGLGREKQRQGRGHVRRPGGSSPTRLHDPSRGRPAAPGSVQASLHEEPEARTLSALSRGCGRADPWPRSSGSVPTRRNEASAPFPAGTVVAALGPGRYVAVPPPRTPHGGPRGHCLGPPTQGPRGRQQPRFWLICELALHPTGTKSASSNGISSLRLVLHHFA